MAPTVLQRETFRTSRLGDFFTLDELEQQTGHASVWWPEVILKELIDNGLDACEQAGVAPEITVRFRGHKLEIRDNGEGIRPEIVTWLVDYTTRTSDKLAYVSPTRGAQGNAWKTIFAMPYVLDGQRSRPITIEACGVRHQIHVCADQIQRRPRIDYWQQELPVKNCGTAIFLERDQAYAWKKTKIPNFYRDSFLATLSSIPTRPSGSVRTLSRPLIRVGQSGLLAIPRHHTGIRWTALRNWSPLTWPPAAT